MIPIYHNFRQDLVGLVVEYNRLTLDDITVELIQNTTCQCRNCTNIRSSALCGNGKELAKTPFKVDTVHGATLI